MPQTAPARIIAHRLSQSSYQVLHRFSLRRRDPSALPATGLVAVNGTLYGTTSAGGEKRIGYNYGCGTVYSMSPAGVFKTLHRFHCSDGAAPEGTLLDVNGTLYGTTSQGGSFGQGVLFSITTDGVEKVLHNFKARSDGADPRGALVYLKGKLYGTTYLGGGYECSINGCGTVYSVSATGTEKVLYSFRGGSTDGEGPVTGLTDVKGILYGTTVGGGSSGAGTVYTINTAGVENVLYSFGGGSDGSYPAAALIDVNGMLYGTTSEGGSSKRSSRGYGTVYSLSTRGSEKVLYRFCPKHPNCSDGADPQSALLNLNGTLYGTTYSGGASGCNGGCGLVYSVDMSGSETVLHRFMRGSDASHSLAEFVNVNGTLYSTTIFGGSTGCFYGAGCGTVFALTP
jgi:uncharacterized repeat protein (TIGR03803 family)